MDSRTSEGHIVDEKEHDVWTSLAKGCPNLEELIVRDCAEFSARRRKAYPAFMGDVTPAKFREVFEHVVPIHESSVSQAFLMSFLRLFAESWAPFAAVRCNIWPAVFRLRDRYLSTRH